MRPTNAETMIAILSSFENPEEETIELVREVISDLSNGL